MSFRTIFDKYVTNHLLSVKNPMIIFILHIKNNKIPEGVIESPLNLNPVFYS